jgi:hypothetical protein
MTRIKVIFKERQERVELRRFLKSDPAPYMW